MSFPEDMAVSLEAFNEVVGIFCYPSRRSLNKFSDVELGMVLELKTFSTHQVCSVDICYNFM